MKRKPTGDREFFLEIWNERPHKCEECGKDLGRIPQPIFFSHILTKGRTPELRLNKKNIELLCPKHHMEWETADLEKKRKFKWSKEKSSNIHDYQVF